jgi:LysR family transcriptional regulator, chromosome initiation inhibitor
MLNYQSLYALSTVIRTGSFESAARKLSITPSAVSQRIKQLEEAVGSALIKRGQPCTATASGMLLAQHAERVQFMEAELCSTLPAVRKKGSNDVRRFKVAINDDSLSTWFIDTVADFCIAKEIMLDVVIEDEDHSIELVRDGSVQAAISSQSKALTGWGATYLGKMQYVAVCSPSFSDRYFREGATEKAFSVAPQIAYTAKDRLQNIFVRKLMKACIEPPVHKVPHTPAYVSACLSGMAWGVCPLSLVNDLIINGKLIDFCPTVRFEMELYWHFWKIAVKWMADFGEHVEKNINLK